MPLEPKHRNPSTAAEGLLATLSMPPYLYGGAAVQVDDWEVVRREIPFPPNPDC